MFRHALFSLIVPAALVLGAPSASAESRLALVIGQSAYKSVPALPNPINDAKAVTQMLTDLPDLRMQVVNHGVHIAQKFGERLARDVRVIELRAPHRALPVKLLQQVGFQVTAARRIHDMKQTEQRAAMVDTFFARGEDTCARE